VVLGSYTVVPAGVDYRVEITLRYGDPGPEFVPDPAPEQATGRGRGLVPRGHALAHPATRFAVQTSGVAVAVRMTARDDELAAIEQLYVDAR
jgi:hypothetical protein